ncbi:SUMF1/EgtB/PvdO family nonheme iron enzyme [Haloferula sp. A504]|uniref:SUMF1/EgtB/PvdO family nonheme iron enzyme n=1 Tax=Haloferula sp. A504 TaxID=3373601 RepID=UPI0031C867C3|nr:SUMF1/EgtB/PvdO family nonheme iron enzyme [Verrucomicrobiaceae bacterium E54]
MKRVRTPLIAAFLVPGILGATSAGDLAALRRGIDHLDQTFGEDYPRAAEFRQRLEAIERTGLEAAAGEFAALRREALLANPLLDFDGLLVVRRRVGDAKGKAAGRTLGLPQNWQGNCALPRNGYDNEIAVLPWNSAAGKPRTLFHPEQGEFVGDLDLSYDGRRILFSMPDSSGKGKPWHLWEMETDGTAPRRLTPDDPGVDQYDGCYLPDGRIIYGSTAGFQGVPCVGGSLNVSNLFQLDPATGVVRQLCYDQDHNWNPVVMADGRVLYTRWEYTDTAHYFSRQLFSMNPDGTAQMSVYGSNSYWPNSLFYTRPLPGDPGKVVTVVSGHHGDARAGELVVLDLGKDTHEAGGVVQRIPGHGKTVEAVTTDQLVRGVYPRFLHPYPLSTEHFLVSCQPTPRSPWGIWLVDVFDNMIPLHEEPGVALLEPLPLGPRQKPALIPDRFDPASDHTEVFLSDIYQGPGLQGVPRGSVKRLRLYEYHYAYRKMGGHLNVGIDGPWDVRRILGTVPVEADGSAHFRIPANTPVALQPIDDQGRALQIMRSWFTGQPGERLSCVGCHEGSNQVAAPLPAAAALKPPVEITPWQGRTRGFDFGREIQPVLDRHCASCHDGGDAGPDLRGGRPEIQLGKGQRFDASYAELHRYIHRPGPESDSHLALAGEYFAETSELMRMLRKGHHGVRLDRESFERLVTWIDLNVPDHGSWGEQRKVPDDYDRRRLEARIRYAGRAEDPEQIGEARPLHSAPSAPAKTPTPKTPAAPRGWPLQESQAIALQEEAGRESVISLREGPDLNLAAIPAGEFLMGDSLGSADETPRLARISRPFRISTTEITNAQFRVFEADHDSGVLSTYNKDATSRGLDMTRDAQPAARVSWEQAQAFCEWLSARSGRTVRLPTEEEWEWACRAGDERPLHYGSLEDDFRQHANLADRQLARLCRRDSPRWVPHVENVDDGHTGPAPVASYRPNRWGLHDMHGNLAEWTSSRFDPEGFLPSASQPGDWRVVKGGSFRSRPSLARAAYRCGYPKWLRPHDVGFRIVVEMP